MDEPSEKPNLKQRITELAAKGAAFQRNIWQSNQGHSKFHVDIGYTTLRVISITLAGIKENRIFNRAGALSFSSLLGLGPLIAIMVLVSGFVLDKTDPDFAIDSIDKAINYVAPQVRDFETDGDAQGTTEDLSQAEDNEEVRQLLQQFIDGSQSGTIGVIGMIALILVVVQLFTAIEDAFNDIWGVKRGRNWSTRIIMYWTVMTLGGVLAFAGFAVLAAEAYRIAGLAGVLGDHGWTETLVVWITRGISFTAIVAILTFFYRFIPNTPVTWRASIIGAFFTIVCFGANNALSFLYMSYVARQKTLYGPVSFIPVLMIGLFFFWLILLFGGRVTYAVQNSRFKSDKIAWEGLSLASQESISLLLFTKICRRFRNCQPAISANELCELTKLPIQNINASCEKLCSLGLAVAIPPGEDEPMHAYKYQPAKPLDKIRLLDFKEAFENQGSRPDSDLFDDYEPIVKRYHDMVDEARGASLGTLTFEGALENADDQPGGSQIRPFAS